MSLYRMDCEVERRRGLKRIEDHTPRELNAAVRRAVQRFGDDFWIMLHGIDAYMERRERRKDVWGAGLVEEPDMWGHS